MRLPGNQAPKLCSKFCGVPVLCSVDITLIPFQELAACSLSLTIAVCAASELEQTQEPLYRNLLRVDRSSVAFICIDALLSPIEQLTLYTMKCITHDREPQCSKQVCFKPSREFVTLVPSLSSQLCYQRLQMPPHTRCILVSTLLCQDSPKICADISALVFTPQTAHYLSLLLPPHALAAC